MGPKLRNAANPLYSTGSEPKQSGVPKNLWAFAAGWLWCCAVGDRVWAASSPIVRPGVPYTIDKWDTEKGLPQNSVIAMTQTRDGYLWLGTLNGLVRFDGTHFEVFDESNTPGLDSSRIVSLFEDSKTNLWIGTETAGVMVMSQGEFISPGEIGWSGAERRLAA